MAKAGKPGRRSAKRGTEGKKAVGAGNDWRRRYYLPDDSIMRAATDLYLGLPPPEIEEYAGRMFALQDLVEHDQVDKVAVLEKETNEPAYLEIVRAVRKEALEGDPGYARSIAGQFLEEAFPKRRADRDGMGPV